MTANNELALARELNQILKAKDVTIAIAEGTTGGRVGERLTRYAGATKYFKGSIATYDYSSRTTLLDISENQLKSFGSVSEWCARQMAERVRGKLGTTIGLASTGVAGPAGLNVGHLWLAIAQEDGTVAEEHYVSHRSRLQMQAVFSELALQLLRRMVG